MKISRNKFQIRLANTMKPMQVLIDNSNVSKTVVSNILNGRKTTVRPSTVGKLAKALGCKVEDLLED